jgi:hypothetical protein
MPVAEVPGAGAALANDPYHDEERQQAAYDKLTAALDSVKTQLDSGQPFTEGSDAMSASEWIYWKLGNRYNLGSSPDDIVDSLTDWETDRGLTATPNPAFTQVRGGAFANPRRGATLATDLADHLRGIGLAEPIASQYNRLPTFLSGEGPVDVPNAAGYYRHAPDASITLKKALDALPENQLYALARHEAVHAYDYERGISDSADFQDAFYTAMLTEPDLVEPFLRTVPKNPATADRRDVDWGHLYTAGFDAVGRLDTLPRALLPFYEGLLPDLGDIKPLTARPKARLEPAAFSLPPEAP